MAAQVHGAAMLSSTRHPILSEPVPEPVPEMDFAERPALALAHLLAGGLMEVCGPLFWAILAVGFLFAEFALDWVGYTSA